MEAREGPPPLPRGWGELRTGDGRPYYVYYPTEAVQWERPKPPTDSEGGDVADKRQSPELGQQPLSASTAAAETEVAAAVAGAGAAVGTEAVGPGGEAVAVEAGGGRDAGYPGADDALRGEVRLVFCVPCLLRRALGRLFCDAVRIHNFWCVRCFVFVRLKFVLGVHPDRLCDG